MVTFCDIYGDTKNRCQLKMLLGVQMKGISFRGTQFSFGLAVEFVLLEE